jgi:hypothetical protein
MADGMAPEREDDSREPEDLDGLIDEFGDRSGPDPVRDPELELEDDEVILDPSADDDEGDQND